MQGKKVYGYTLLRQLGKGGMAEVWYAENKIHKSAAVKILLPKYCDDADVVNRFRTEAEVMVKLAHQHIRQVYDYDEVDGRPCIVMEYLDGCDLSARIKEGEYFSEERIRKWWNQIVPALKYTHEQGVVHRDIKPSNIFIDREDNVKLLDFGIAKVRDSINSTHTGTRMGTLMYMSPEQADDAKNVDYRSDIYSLAVTFVCLFQGHAPYDENTMSQRAILNHIAEKPLDMTGVPAEWKKLLSPYLAKEKKKRPELASFESLNPELIIVESDDVGTDTVIDIVDPKEEPPIDPNKDPTLIIETSDEQKQEEVKESREEEPEQEVKDTSDTNTKKRKWVWIVFGVLAVIGVILLIGAFHDPSKDKSGGNTDTTQVATAPFSDTTIAVNGVKLKMIAVEGGEFKMMTKESNKGDVEEKDVKVESFWMSETEVTVELWNAVLGSQKKVEANKLPVVYVNDDMNEFIKKLNKITGKKFRLPTEAEWQYAARGGKKTKNSKNFTYSGSDNIEDVGWYYGNSQDENSQPQIHEVRQKNPNELGFYDMSGNVWEVCKKQHNSDSFCYCGGSYSTDPYTCAPVYRNNNYEGKYTGLRLIMEKN